MAPKKSRAEEAVQEPEAKAETKWPRVRPAGKHDNEAGIELYEFGDKPTGRYEMRLAFRDGKPSDEVRQYMKDNGFKWDGEAEVGNKFKEVNGAWWRPIGFNSGATDRLVAERTYYKVAEMIRAERGIEAPEVEQGQHVPF